MTSLLVFILILSVLILIHEFGHFIVAKKSGVKVEEFGMGIPPRVIGKRFGETIYSLNLLPFGGFVKLFGEDPDEVTPEMKSSPRSFLSKTPLQRAAILSAGVFMNFVLAIALYYLFFVFTGFRSQALAVYFDYNFRFGKVVNQNTVVSGFSDDSPAKLAGIEPGEAILEIDGVAVSNISEIRDRVSGKAGETVNLFLTDLRYTSEQKTRVVPVELKADDEGKGILGVFISESAVISYPNKLVAPFQHSYNMLAYTGHTFGKFIKMAFETKSVEPVSSGVTGPVGIYSVVGGILDFGGKVAFLALIDFMALLSLSLALLNILPLPALDGGRLVFVVIEGITGKQVDQRIETAVHKWGMIFFFGLLILITIKDIRQFLL